MAQSRSSRHYTLIAAGLAVILLLAWAFWPRAMPVDIGDVQRQPMMVTIDEEARTRVRDAYVVSAPIAGRLMRVDVEPGDSVVGGETVIARMLPSAPSAIDVRTREQARAGVDAAEARLRVARADLNSALAGQELAAAEVARARALTASGTLSRAGLDQAEREKRAADAAVNTARAAISMRQAELANARAQLIEFGRNANGSTSATGENGPDQTIPLTAPISGQILRVLQESEVTVSAGQPVLEIGDVGNDLEVIAELLSTDAVQVEPGDRVLIDNWGGDVPLHGIVERVEPWGFTKYSALGVEEQRVNTIVRFTEPIETRRALGHGYRVEVRVVIWEDDAALTVPSSALFRVQDGWALFQVVNGRAVETMVEVARNNGRLASLETALEPGSRVILYPGPDLDDGMRVQRRRGG